MKGFCPSCEKESELNHIHRIEAVNVKGEFIPVEMDYFVCVECGEEFTNPESSIDPLKTAYKEYRRRKGMLKPEEIKAFREKYELTQRELSELLGFGGATISRYENGALQDEVHDTLLRMATQPKNLLYLLTEKAAVLSTEKRTRIVQQIEQEAVRLNLLCCLEDLPHYRAGGVLTGSRTLDIDRLLSVVERLCYQIRVAKTKLNKLLFYVDFLSYRANGQSITGLCYVHLPLGPVPDQYETIFEALQKLDPSLREIEEIYDDSIRIHYVYDREPQDNRLTYAEERIIMRVAEYFRGFTAKQIVDFSHKEEAYIRTTMQEIIPYTYAQFLRIEAPNR